MRPRYRLLAPPVGKNPTLRVRCGFGRSLTGHRRIWLRYPDVCARSRTARIESIWCEQRRTNMRLENKVAIVTGCARERGIGKAIALRLAREGANVVAA